MRDAILNLRRVKEYTLPGTDQKVYFRQWSVAERRKYMNIRDTAQKAGDEEAQAAAWSALSAELLVQSLSDKDGNRAFKDGEEQAVLDAVPGVIMDELVALAIIANTPQADDIEQAKKNSARTPN